VSCCGSCVVKFTFNYSKVVVFCAVEGRWFQMTKAKTVKEHFYESHVKLENSSASHGT